MVSLIKSYIHILGPLLLFLFTHLPYQILSGYSICLDVNTRINVNDPFVSIYYFWWTNLLYLPFFFFVFIYLLTYLVTVQHEVKVFGVLIIFLMVYPLELWDYLTSNVSITGIFYHSYGLNTLLTNTLNRYHPLVFYASLFSIFGIFFLLKTFFIQCTKFSVAQLLVITYKVAWSGVTINLFGLWMGSWWALQEGTWGGWWNWDSSETFGLVVSLLLLSVMHAPLNIEQWNFLKLKLLIMIYFFILSFFFIQLNFELVSHNFGAKFFFFFNNNLFFLETLLLMLVLITLTYYLGVHSKAQISLFNYLGLTATLLQRYLYATRFTIALLLSFWVFASYQPLVTYFAWNFAQLNILNFEVSLQYVNTLLWSIGLCWLFKFRYEYGLIILLTTFFVSNWKILFLVFIPLSSLYWVLHCSIIFITSLNLLLFDLIIYHWVMVEDYSYWLFSNSVITSSEKYFTLDTFATEYSDLSLLNGFSNSSLWNLSTSTNSPLLNFFSLLISNDLASNMYTLSTNYTSVHFYMELPLITQLNFLILLLLGLSLKLTLFHTYFYKF
jgi:hypothetical protein